MIEVTFRAPDEIDLAFYYLDRQYARFEEEGILLPCHEVSLGEKEIVILMWYPDDEDDSGNDDGNDPIWPIEPVNPEPEGLIVFEPEWTETWSS